MAQGLSPRNIINHLPHVNYNNIKYKFGQYVQIYVTQKFTNTMKSRTIGAIVLGPNNFKGKYNFMSLEMLEKIDGRVIAILPITEVIRRVEQLGQEQNQPLQASRMLKYEQRPGIEVAPEDARADILEEPQETIELEPIEQHINHNKTTWETYKEAVQDKGAGPSQNKGSESDLDNLRQSKRTDKNEGLGRNKGLDGNKGVEETDGSKESEDEDSNDE